MAEEGQAQEKWTCSITGGQKATRESYSIEELEDASFISDIRNTLVREWGTSITGKRGGGSSLQTKHAGRSGGCRTGLANNHGMVVS